MDVDGAEMMRHVTVKLTLRIRRAWLLRVRCWVGVRLFWVACRVTGCRGEVEARTDG